MFYNYMLYPFLMPPIPNDLDRPPTLYSILESIVNYGTDDKTKIKDLAKEGRGTIFNFTYPLSNKISKEEFETNILNHFIERRIGFETVTMFRIKLNVKLNEIMPKYNKLFDSLDEWDLFKDGEIVEREQNFDGTTNNLTNQTNEKTSNTENSNTTTNNLTNQTTLNTQNQTTLNTQNQTTFNTQNPTSKTSSETTVVNADSNSSNTIENSSESDSSSTVDKRSSDTPQSELSNIQSASYLTNYEYDTTTNHAEDTSSSNGTAESESETTTNSNISESVTNNKTGTETTANTGTETTANTGTETTTNTGTVNEEGSIENVENAEQNTTSNTTDKNKTTEIIKRSPSDKLKIYLEFMENCQNIYTLIYKDLDCLFYQLI